jgi:hypothetical protein
MEKGSVYNSCQWNIMKLNTFLLKSQEKKDSEGTNLYETSTLDMKSNLRV